MEQVGYPFKPGQYLIHDRDTKFCAAFKQMLDDAGVKHVLLPPRSLWLNGYAECWIQSVKTEGLSPMILFGERRCGMSCLNISCIITPNGRIRARAMSFCFHPRKWSRI